MFRVPADACLFCLKNDGPFTSEEHIVPESVSNETIILPTGVVCYRCNNYFSVKLENHFVNYYAGAFQKVLFLEKTKKGKPPKIPLLDQGEAKRNEDGTLSFRQYIQDGKEDTQFKLTIGERITFSGEWYPPPADAKKISRFLAKAGLETVFLKFGDEAFSSVFNPIRNYARYGQPSNRFVPFLWHKDTWSNSDVRQLDLTLKKTNEIFAVLAAIQAPGALYVIPLFCGDELFALEKAKIKIMEWQVRDFKFELVATPGQIIPEPIKWEITP